MAVGTTRNVTGVLSRDREPNLTPISNSSAQHSCDGGPNSKAGWFKASLLVGSVGFLAWASYKVTRPPPPKICGSPGGPPVTALRVRLKDGRYLAYVEHGVPRDIAKRKIVFVHGFDSCRHDVSAIMAGLSADIVQSEGIYMVSFDRPGYGESDPHPTRTVKSLAYDIEELADQLGLGSKFYVVGFSLGGQIVWTCLKYIPHRLAGAALIAPTVNYWWPGLPSDILQQAYRRRTIQDQWTFRVAHYLPWLSYWWNTQKLFLGSSIITRRPTILSDQDKELLPRMRSIRKDYLEVPRQQGEFESVIRDAMIGFGKWEFDPTDLKNPFLESEGSVHLWQGDDDLFVSVTMQRYIADQLPWIHYHEVPGAGHLLPFADGMADFIIQTLVA